MPGQYNDKSRMTAPISHVSQTLTPLTGLQLEAAENLNQIGFLTWEAGHGPVRLSAIAQGLLGLPEDVPLGTLLDLLDPNERPSLQTHWGEVLAAGQRNTVAEFAAVLPDGRRRFGANALFEHGADGVLRCCVVAGSWT